MADIVQPGLGNLIDAQDGGTPRAFSDDESEAKKAKKGGFEFEIPENKKGLLLNI